MPLNMKQLDLYVCIKSYIVKCKIITKFIAMNVESRTTKALSIISSSLEEY